MRSRLAVALVLLASVLVALPAAASSQAGPSDDPGRGLVYGGLKRGPANGTCGGALEVRHGSDVVGCTHGPDPAPPDVDPGQRRGPDPAAAQQSSLGQSGTAESATAGVFCDGDGTSGYRVQLIYAHASDVPDRYSQFLSSFRLWAARMDDIVSASAVETGGTRHIRFVHDSSCNPTVADVQLSPAGDDLYDNTVWELKPLGYSRTDRKYLVWVDANVYCGISDVRDDDQPGVNNLNNGHPSAAGMVGRVDNGCWGQPDLVEAHELGHILGAVQLTAPHATPLYHCTDEWDRMCYSDGSGAPVTYACSSFSHDARYDCNHDDYFSTAPAPGGYLATHWNTANSRFLSGNGLTSVTPTSGSAGSTITASATGAASAGVAYVLKFSMSAATCPNATQIGGPTTSSASRDIPATSGTIPFDANSGTNFICFARASDPGNFTAPAPYTVI